MAMRDFGALRTRTVVLLSQRSLAHHRQQSGFCFWNFSDIQLRQEKELRPCPPARSGVFGPPARNKKKIGVRVRFRVRLQAVKVPIFGGFPVENPTNKANRLEALLKGISLSEYGSEGCRVRLWRFSEYGSVAYFVERPTWETQAEQYSDTVL